MNFLEQLCAEWLEYNGYFVRRNVHVGRLEKGGWECELDVVGFHPKSQHLIHVEPSMDASSWEVRARRYEKKFRAGRTYIPRLFDGVVSDAGLDQVALFGLGAKTNVSALAGGRVMHAVELLAEIAAVLRTRHFATQAVPEQYVCLRTIQFTVRADRTESAARPLIRSAPSPGG